jgi:hypothetical protein
VDMAANIVKEFSSDINHKFHRHHDKGDSH